VVGAIALQCMGKGWWMNILLRWTGLAKLVSFYRHFAFNGPRVTTAVGVVLVVGLVAIQMYWLAGGFPLRTYPLYLAVYFALVVAAGLLASVAMVLGSRPMVAGTGWVMGSVVAAASIGMYAASRTAGLPGLPDLVAWWDYPLGTFSMAVAALFMGLHFSVLTGMNVAYPQRRHWHD
jgi:hypothetical protein